jgi:hypothetical protein
MEDRINSGLLFVLIERAARPGNPGFDRWELHPEIRIDYVNSFTRLNAAGG